MTRKSLLLGPGLLVCLLAASPLAGGSGSARARRDVAIVGGQWTWGNGSDHTPDWERHGVYGSKGVAAPANRPGARAGSISWTDTSGNLWLFGGWGETAKEYGYGYLNDLWKWDGSNWAWVSGSNLPNQVGTYGTRGVASPGNVPGARTASVSWTDASGDLWLFGGYAQSPGGGGWVHFNDLWKWDGTSWTWESGSDGGNQSGAYGTKGVGAPGNVPGAREASVSWTDESGSLWLFGGFGLNSHGVWGDLNDLWKWDGTNWTWVSGWIGPSEPGTYGTKGVAAPGNVPGARENSVSWTDASGDFWLFGGSGCTEGGWGSLNDLWKWDGTNWTWMSGSDGPGQSGTYGTRGLPAPGNVPGARYRSVSWTDVNGDLWLFGGYGDAVGDSGYLNDLWRWDGTSWTWMSGSTAAGQFGSYGTRGSAAPGNTPGGRQDPVSWTDASGSLWLFGGFGLTAIDQGSLNDLWKWDGTSWAWMGGANGVIQHGTYGTKGVAAPGNLPGARDDSVSWTDTAGKLWLLGGQGFAASGLAGKLNDLWSWDGTDWIWVSGSNETGPFGAYGVKGVAAPGNVPGGRSGSVSWTSTNGDLWLFGGEGNAAESAGLLNDLWKWDGASWTWVSGSNGPHQSGVYGTKGVAAPGNVPGARKGAVSWTDASGALWLFGGSMGPYWELNDLWKWDGTNWTWMSGSEWSQGNGVYGTKGIAAPGNAPGAREDAVSWRDPLGNFWLFGGNGHASLESGYLNDLWRWDGTNWTWMSGSNLPYQLGSYGMEGVPAPGNVPGARSASVSWTDASGNLWLSGGEAWMASGRAVLNDLWKWDGASWTWVRGSDGADQLGTYGTKGVGAPENVPGARLDATSWTDASGNLWLFGGHGFDSAGVQGPLNDLWGFGPVCTSLAPPTAGNGSPYGTGATIHLTASTVAGATWFWTGPNGFTSTAQNPTIPNATMAMAGTYDVRAIVGGCTSPTATTIVDVFLAHALVVTRIGSGTGSVISTPSGIDCGGACSASFPALSQVTLTAAPDGSSRFAGWTGEGCAGTDPCSVTMDAARSVSATFLPAGGVGFHTLTPCRIVDTRNTGGPWGGPALEAGVARAFEIAGRCGVPADAAAVALNVTVTNPTSAGSLTVYPGMGLAPGTSTVSFAAGRTRANNVTIGLIGGFLAVLDRQETGTADVIIDVSGYYR